MSHKLIKEAEVLSTLSADDLAAYKVIQKATGKKTIAEIVVEVFRPTRNDYMQWLRVITEYAKDGKIPLNSKGAFSDIAGATLENDPANPPVEMHAAIINKLWADYRAGKQHAKVEQMARAQEEEEDQYGGDEPMDVDDLGDTHEPGHDRNGDNYDSTERFGATDSGEIEPEGEDMVTCPDCGHEFVPGEEPLSDEDTEKEPGSDEDITPGGEDTGNRDIGAERFGKMGDQPRGGHIGDERQTEYEEQGAGYRIVDDIGMCVNGPSYSTQEEAKREQTRFYPGDRYSVRFGSCGTGRRFVEQKRAYHEEDEQSSIRRSPMTAKIGEEISPKPKSILQQVLTAPREQMNAALKDIEADGAAAWTAHTLPKNPHTKGSLAHRKWASGLKKAMKTHLGLDAAPVAAKPKPKKR